MVVHPAMVNVMKEGKKARAVVEGIRSVHVTGNVNLHQPPHKEVVEAMGTDADKTEEVDVDFTEGSNSSSRPGDRSHGLFPWRGCRLIRGTSGCRVATFWRRQLRGASFFQDFVGLYLLSC